MGRNHGGGDWAVVKQNGNVYRRYRNLWEAERALGQMRLRRYLRTEYRPKGEDVFAGLDLSNEFKAAVIRR